MSEFEKWYKEKYYKYDLYPKYAQFRKEMKEVWQAATAESDKRIAELEATVQELRHMQGVNTDFATLELQAHINVLREALEIAVEYQRSDVANFHSAYAGYKDEKHEQYDEDLKLVENALASTPAQSLIQHDNDVIERCAKVCESLKEQDYCVDVRAGADEIRALKG